VDLMKYIENMRRFREREGYYPRGLLSLFRKGAPGRPGGPRAGSRSTDPATVHAPQPPPAVEVGAAEGLNGQRQKRGGIAR
jgi:hypothetical protein